MKQVFAALLLTLALFALVGLWWGERGVIPKAAKELPLDEWHTFHSDRDGFTVRLPVLPQYAHQFIDNPDGGDPLLYGMYLAERGQGAIFFIRTITYPKESTLSTEAQVSSVEQDLTRRGLEGKILSSNKHSYNGEEAVDYHIDLGSDEMLAKSFARDNVLYTLGYMTDKEIFAPPEYEYFVDSFRIDAGK